MGTLPSWLVESWVEWAIAMVVVLVRVVSRTTAIGFRQWQGDDYLILLATICYTISLVSDQMFYLLGNNHVVTDDQLIHMSAHGASRIRVGSIWDFVGWTTYATLIWCCKACMLFLYSRLTLGLPQRRLVKISAYLCAITFIGCWLGMLLKCQPVSRNWQVSPPPGDCVKGKVNLYVIGILNFTTDILLLAIPIPLIMHLHVPLKKKLLIALLLLSGIFILVAIVLRVTLTLLILYGKYRQDKPYDLGFMLAWSNRENFVSIIVVNVPIIVSSIKYKMGHRSSRHSATGLRDSEVIERSPWGSAGSAAVKEDQDSKVEKSGSDHEVPIIPTVYQEEIAEHKGISRIA